MQNIDKNQENWLATLRRGILDWREPLTPAELTRDQERHFFPEAFFELSGHCAYQLNSEILHLRPGSCCFIRPQVPHQNGFQTGLADLCDQLWFNVREHEYRCGIVRSRPDGGCFMVKSFSLPGAYGSMGSYLLNSDEPGSGKWRSFFELLICEVISILERPEPVENQLVPALESLIRSRNGRCCTLAELEKFFGYSRSHLSHQYQQSTGRSIGDFIDSVRLEMTTLMTRRGMKQKEIAVELGFSSPSAFWLWKKRQREKAAVADR